MKSSAKKILQLTALSIFFLFIIVYAFFRSQDLIFGIKIKNVNIQNGQIVQNSILQITGNAEKAINLTLNGREISIDQNSNFNETIALLPGYNIINLTAKDKFGDIDEKNYQIIRH